jgi:peptidylprolyl isomerase
MLVGACGYADPGSAAAGTGPVAGTDTSTPTPSASPSAGADDFNAGAGLPTVTLPDGLKYIDLKVGSGPKPAKGDTIEVQYTGWLNNGTKFDSSRDRGQPASFQIGVGAVIPGWDEAVLTMNVGGKRKLIIPPALAYGAQGRPPTIPANSTLVFTVELMSTMPTPSPSPTP